MLCFIKITNTCSRGKNVVIFFIGFVIFLAIVIKIISCLHFIDIDSFSHRFNKIEN